MALPPWVDPIGAALAQHANAGADFAAQQLARARDAIFGMGLDGNAAPDSLLLQLADPNIGSGRKAYLIQQWAGGRGGGGGGGGGRGGGGGGGGGGSSGPSIEQQQQQYLAEITNMAGLMGLEGDWSGLAAQAVANKWSVEMLRDQLADRITVETARRAGLVKSVFEKARETGGDYFMDISDGYALSYAKRIARGELDAEGMVDDIKNLAYVKYDYLAPQLQQGVTMRQLFEPQRQSIAKLMEVAPESVDFTHDMRWWNVLAVRNLDGTRRARDVAETEAFVRSLDDWKQTQNAKSTSAQAGTAIGRIFGAVA